MVSREFWVYVPLDHCGYGEVLSGDIERPDEHYIRVREIVSNKRDEEIERLTTENGRLGTIIDKALDEGYLSNEWLQRELDSASDKQD